jgi:hypothetical protein
MLKKENQTEIRNLFREKPDKTNQHKERNPDKDQRDVKRKKSLESLNKKT